jgi:hypothetical protein
MAKTISSVIIYLLDLNRMISACRSFERDLQISGDPIAPEKEVKIVRQLPEED